VVRARQRGGLGCLERVEEVGERGRRSWWKDQLPEHLYLVRMAAPRKVLGSRKRQQALETATPTIKSV
jgi:hypothetical protein